MDSSHKDTIDDSVLRLRPANIVMNLERLGSLYQYRLSFMRTLVRRFMSEKWQIQQKVFELDQNGYGHTIYEIVTPNNTYSFVIFASFLDPSRRSDRVIADAWDMTVCLCIGTIDKQRLNWLSENVPLQEAGRLDADCLVLSRANKSVRNFEYVVDTLASGRQPSMSAIAKVGYLYRTTAVYGSGKFGIADWKKIRANYPDFARPFAAEMFSCYLIRQFSLDQADFLAQARAPATAVPMDDEIKRYMGIGNATGLGMAPYLINHPLLINRWIEARETALARVLYYGKPDPDKLNRFEALVSRSIQHLREIATDNENQNAINVKTANSMVDFLAWFKARGPSIKEWSEVTAYLESDIESQELVNTLLIEVYPDLVENLEDTLCVDEGYELIPEMRLGTLREIIETQYDWVTTHSTSDAVFWYRSEEKMEPRLGLRDSDPGVECEMDIGVARSVRWCYDALCNAVADQTVARFVLRYPEFRSIVRRIQTMSKTHYGDIQANLLAADVLPIHLLRCKLSFFGVAKFDPKSRLWVRNTMFQGAPIQDDIGKGFVDDWAFPVMP